jgi:hypothetical protein
MFANCHVTANANPRVDPIGKRPRPPLSLHIVPNLETLEGSLEFAMALDHETPKYIPCPNWETPEAAIEFAHRAKLGNT